MEIGRPAKIYEGVGERFRGANRSRGSLRGRRGLAFALASLSPISGAKCGSVYGDALISVSPTPSVFDFGPDHHLSSRTAIRSATSPTR